LTVDEDAFWKGLYCVLIVSIVCWIDNAWRARQARKNGDIANKVWLDKRLAEMDKLPKEKADANIPLCLPRLDDIWNLAGKEKENK
jgi:hypothetical protein